MSFLRAMATLAAIAFVGLGAAGLSVSASPWAAASTTGASVAQPRSTSTTAPTSTSSTSSTGPDPDLGRRLGARPPESTGEAIQGGPMWIGVVVAVSGAAGVAYALGRVPQLRRAQTWPRRRRSRPGRR